MRGGHHHVENCSNEIHFQLIILWFGQNNWKLAIEDHFVAWINKPENLTETQKTYPQQSEIRGQSQVKTLPSDPRWSRQAPWQPTASGLQGRGWPSPWWVRSGAGRRLHGWIPVSLWGWGLSGCHWTAGRRGWRAGWVTAWAGQRAEGERGKTEREVGCFRQTLAVICDVVQAGEILQRRTTSKKRVWACCLAECFLSPTLSPVTKILQGTFLLSAGHLWGRNEPKNPWSNKSGFLESFTTELIL